MTGTSLYETDIVAWADRQVAELRRLAASASSNSVDWANVIEEIESVGRSEWKGVRSQLRNALAQVIKGACDPDSLSRVSWGGEVATVLVEARLDYRPSMRAMLDVDEIWDEAFRIADAQLRSYKRSIPPGMPAKSPFALEEILDGAFTYEAAVRRLILLFSDRQEITP